MSDTSNPKPSSVVVIGGVERSPGPITNMHSSLRIHEAPYPPVGALHLGALPDFSIRRVPASKPPEIRKEKGEPMAPPSLFGDVVS